MYVSTKMLLIRSLWIWSYTTFHHINSSITILIKKKANVFFFFGKPANRPEKQETKTAQEAENVYFLNNGLFKSFSVNKTLPH